MTREQMIDEAVRRGVPAYVRTYLCTDKSPASDDLLLGWIGCDRPRIIEAFRNMQMAYAAADRLARLVPRA